MSCPALGIFKVFELMAFTKNDEAVSPVIGVILMVAITVILAAVIAAFVFGMAGNIQTTKVVSLTMTDAGTHGVVTISGGTDLTSLQKVYYSVDGTAQTPALFTTGDISVGAYKATAGQDITGKRVIVTGLFSDGSTQILIDKQF